MGASPTVFKNEWVLRGPELPELIAGIKDGRKGRKNKTAIVIPTFHREKILREHLQRLSKQDYREFDCIVVYGCDDGFLDDTFGLSVCHIKRKGDIGSAGGFYLGEKYCLQEGYERIILADDDCFPVSENLLKQLVAEMEDGADLVLPKIISGAGAKPEHNRILAQYGGIRTQALNKTGLTYLPIYMYGEDIELYHRIADSGLDIRYIEATAYHPPLDALLSYPPKKAYASHKGTLVWRALRGKWGRMLFGSFFFLLGGISLLFVNRKLGSAVMKAVFRASTLDFSHKEDMTEPLEFREPIIEKGARLIRLKKDDKFEEDFFGDDWGKKMIKRAGNAVENLARTPYCFGKQVILEGKLGIGEIPMMLAAKNAVWRARGEDKTLAVNRYFYLSPLFAALIAISIPVIFVSCFGLVTFGFLKKTFLGIRTDGYGL